MHRGGPGRGVALGPHGVIGEELPRRLENKKIRFCGFSTRAPRPQPTTGPEVKPRSAFLKAVGSLSVRGLTAAIGDQIAPKRAKGGLFTLWAAGPDGMAEGKKSAALVLAPPMRLRQQLGTAKDFPGIVRLDRASH